MQLGFVSAVLGELSLEEVFAYAADEGFPYVELMCWPCPAASTSARRTGSPRRPRTRTPPPATARRGRRRRTRVACVAPGVANPARIMAEGGPEITARLRGIRPRARACGA